MEPRLETFVSVDPLYKPTDDGKESRVFVTESYDATSHFETTCLDVLNVYERAVGEKLDLDKPRPGAEEAAAAQAAQ